MSRTGSSLRFAPPAATVAVRGRQRFDARHLELAAAAIRARLARTSGARWGVYLESPFVQVAALSALQSLGRTAVLLPHVQSKFIESVRSQLDGLICDGLSAAGDVIDLPPLAALIDEGEGAGGLDGDWRHPVGFLTSGSSGTPTCSLKQPWQIAAEIEIIEAAFGPRIGHDRVVHGTTSHQHLYGFTFRVMWPLLTGRAFADAQMRIPSEVSTAIERFGKIVLISSPAFLARAQQLFDFDQLSAAGLIAFSSGGPLDAATARRFNNTSHVSLIEIYGSTETGALAHRVTRDDEATPWGALPGIEISIQDGLLVARAPHIGDGNGHQTGDRAEALAEGGFLLRGRADQIVKVADKRVSLHELERLLSARPDIDDARVLQLADGSLAAVVVPADAGWSNVRRRGKQRCVAAWRDHLELHVDRVTTPKRWRLVKKIPRNSQGKMEVGALRAMFDGPPARELDWQGLLGDAENWIGTATVPADLPELDGHFPGRPIVPGVAQLRWVADAALRHFGASKLCGGLSGQMMNVKFKRPILPGSTVRLALRMREGARQIEFELASDEHICSSGRLLL